MFSTRSLRIFGPGSQKWKDKSFKINQALKTIRPNSAGKEIIFFILGNILEISLSDPSLLGEQQIDRRKYQISYVY